MQVLVWSALGFALGLGLEPLAGRLAGQDRPACAGCGSPEPGRRLPALLRLIGPAGPRCRACGSWSRCALAVLGPGLAVIFGLLAGQRPPGPGLVATSLYAAVLLLVAVLDLRHRLVYPLLIYPSAAIAIVLTPLALGQPNWSGLAGAAAGALVFLLLYALASVLYRGGSALGLGDVMIAGLIGAMTGVAGIASAIALGTLFGGLGAAAVGLTLRSRRAHFAYGPALCLAALVVLLSQPIT